MINQPIELSLEQEFQLKCFANQVELMSREQAQEFLIKYKYLKPQEAGKNE